MQEEDRRTGSEGLPEIVISNHPIGDIFGTRLEVLWLDGYGLTDAYIARCPPLPDIDRRPGRVERQVRDGVERLEAGDPTLWDEVRATQETPGWPTDEHRERFEELSLMATQAPLAWVSYPRSLATRDAPTRGPTDSSGMVASLRTRDAKRPWTTPVRAGRISA